MTGQTTSNSYPLRAYKLCGTVWYNQKDAMKLRAARINAQCELQMQDPVSGGRRYGCYPTWDDAQRCLAPVLNIHQDSQAWSPHLNEILPWGRRCHGYLDCDGKPDELPVWAQKPDGMPDVNAVIARVEAVAKMVYSEEYNIKLSEDAFLWLHSGNQAKLSLHLVIRTVGEQFMFHSNHYTDPQGAYNLAASIVMRDPDLMGIVDLSVYTKDREMRMCGSSKFEKPLSTLLPYAVPGRQVPTVLHLHDAAITYIRPGAKVHDIMVPGFVPRAVVEGRKRFATVGEARGQARVSQQRSHPLHVPGLVRSRMLELLQDKLHPSAFHDPSHGREDAYDAQCGIKFNYSDRVEPCYTGCVHEGNQNLRCWVHDDQVYVKCYSARCRDRRAHLLGPLHAASDAWLHSALHVHMRHLAWNPEQISEVGSWEGEGGVDVAVAAACDEIDGAASKTLLHQEICNWIKWVFKCLSLRSPMGTGKTTLVQKLLTTYFKGKKVLLVTYRQTLTLEMQRKLQEFGFVSYLDVRGWELEDRAAHPRVICQVDSLPRLKEQGCWDPTFDLVILDEIESMLRHFSSPTLSKPLAVLRLLAGTLERAGHVLSMDAYWGPAAYAFLAKVGLSNRLVVNDFKVPARRFMVDECEKSWQNRLLQDLREGKNLAVASMSTQAIERLINLVVTEGVLPPNQVLCHTSKTADNLKRQLIDVDKLWFGYRLVLYSPHIEAGVDMSAKHFDSMYCYLCRESTTPQGMVQMSGRVRNLQPAEGAPGGVVQVCAPKGLTRPPTQPRLSVEEAQCFLRWMQEEVGRQVPMKRTVVRDWETGRQDWINLPEDDLAMVVFAHNEASAENARKRFFRELEDLWCEGGHQVCIIPTDDDCEAAVPPPEPSAAAEESTRMHDPPSPRQTPAPGPGNEMARLINAPDVQSQDEWQKLRLRITSVQATAEDKAKHDRQLYKRAWGIDFLEPAFIQRHGTSCNGSPQVMLIVRMLFPHLYRAKELSPAYLRQEKQATLVSELLSALGFAGPFDTRHSFQEDLVDVYSQRLKNTNLFQDYKMSAALFSSRAKVYEQWDCSRKLGKVVNMVLGACGLALVSTRHRNGARTEKAAPNTYRLDAGKAVTMRQLVWLKVRRSSRNGIMGLETTNVHAREVLGETRLDEMYDDLVNPDWNTQSWRGADGRTGACDVD